MRINWGKKSYLTESKLQTLQVELDMAIAITLQIPETMIYSDWDLTSQAFWVQMRGWQLQCWP